MTLLQKLDEFPPCLVRMCARNGRGRPMTLKQIAQNCGMSLSLVTWLSQQTTWSCEQVWMVDDYLKGCGFEFSDLAELRKYIKRTSRSKERPFSHLSSKLLTKRQVASIARSAERAADDLG